MPIFVQEVEQLTKKAEGWYEDLNHLEITLFTNHCQQVRSQQNQQEHYEIVWWQPEQLSRVQQRRLEFQTGVQAMRWTRYFNTPLEEILDDSRRDSEIDEDSRES